MVSRRFRSAPAPDKRPPCAPIRSREGSGQTGKGWHADHVGSRLPEPTQDGKPVLTSPSITLRNSSRWLTAFLPLLTRHQSCTRNQNEHRGCPGYEYEDREFEAIAEHATEEDLELARLESTAPVGGERLRRRFVRRPWPQPDIGLLHSSAAQFRSTRMRTALSKRPVAPSTCRMRRVKRSRSILPGSSTVTLDHAWTAPIWIRTSHRKNPDSMPRSKTPSARSPPPYHACIGMATMSPRSRGSGRRTISTSLSRKCSMRSADRCPNAHSRPRSSLATPAPTTS